MGSRSIVSLGGGDFVDGGSGSDGGAGEILFYDADSIELSMKTGAADSNVLRWELSVCGVGEGGVGVMVVVNLFRYCT